MDSDKIIPFSPPRMDKAIIDEVIDTLQSGWITTGPKTKKLEQMLTDYSNHRKTLCVSSGSAGLELMLRWYGVGEGDEVILPAYTYAATANVIVHTGAKPVFVDVLSDFNIDPEDVRAKITERTKIIMPVDIGGLPADYDQIMSIINDDNIRLMFKPRNNHQIKLGRILILADAAHSLGAIYKGKYSGNLTDITVFSFHAVKNLTTAEGGAVCLNLPLQFDVDEIYKELNIKSLHGQTKDALAKTKVGNWRYDIVEAGFKFNMTDISASMGLVEIQRYKDDMLVKRKYIFERYSKGLRDYKWAQIPTYETEFKTSSYHVFMLRIRNVSEVVRDNIIQKIFDKKVSVNVHFMPLPMMTFYKKMGYSIADTPNAFSEYAREISLPVYYDLTDEQIDRVINAVVEAVDEAFVITKG